MKKNTLVILLTSLFINCLYSQNLLVNGGFESGGVGTGFNISATGYNFIPTATGTTSSGDYAFGVNPLPYNSTNFLSGFDHTTGTGSGKMMIIDGSTDPSNPSFWKAGNGGGGVCSLTIGTTYTFSYWVKSISSTVTGTTTQADIRAIFNNATILTSPASTLAPLPASGWQFRTYTFTPTNGCVNIELRNFNLNSVGNDFAIDDLSVVLPLSMTYSSTNTSCIGSNDGSIVAYAVNGTTPYTSYSLSGTASQTNTTGIFSGLAPGTYTISITDSSGTTVSQTGIVISAPTNPLIVNPNSAVCVGTSVTLSASGGSGYSWTSIPTDASLTSPNSPTPTVTPLVTTTYTVSSSVTTNKNLTTNGGFESGNVGFASDYQYFNPSNATFVQKAYGVVSNPNLWEVGFTACPDHTTGTGKMLVVDGSTVNAGNDKFWSQTVPVTAGQNYTFSYWVQSLSVSNYASIELKINGVSIGIDSAPSTITCGSWVQYTYAWSSGASTTAQISLYDKIVSSGGNDFAIDDIAFTTSVTCTFTKSTTVIVNPIPSVVVNNGVLCNTTGSTVQINATVTPAGTYSYSWTVPATAVNPGNVASFNASVIGTYTVVVTNTSTGCVSSPASGTVSNTLPSSNCASATQVCPGGGIRYCNTTGVASAGPRGCLGSTPNPAWFYLQVGTSGPIVLNISQGTTPTVNNLDVDFICYGPFTTPTCGASLGTSNTIDCNYSANPVETCTIPNAIAGQIYMVLITNFANQPGTILFNQTNSANAGAGALTCIVNCPLTITGDNQICQGTSTTLTASISGATTYTWTSTVPGFTAGNTQFINVTEPGTYNLTVVKPGCNITPASFTLTNFPIPNTAPGNDLTVCNTTFNLNLNTPVISNGVPNLTISYYASLNDLNNGIPIPFPATYPGVDGEVIYTQIQDDATFCTYNGLPFTLHIVCTTTCDTVTNPSPNQTLCLNGDPTALSVTTNLTAANAISFVYFNSVQTGSNMYSGGILLSNATPIAGTATYDPPILGNTGSLPNIAGTYYVYAIANPTPTDPACRPFQLIQVVVSPLASINLTSAPSTTNQTVCEGTAIVNITYTFGGSATGATVTGLPIGVSATTSGSTVTISGIPSPASATPYNYTITTTGGNCGTPSLSGTITVNPGVVLTLTSAPATTNQTVCIGSPITPITYTFGGTATNATVIGLPAGVVATVTGTTVTISGTPSVSSATPFNYTVTTTGGSCGTLSLGGTITVNPLATITLTSAAATTNQTVCSGSPIINITYAFGGTATGATVTGLPTGVTATVSGTTVTISGSPIPTGVFPYTITTTGGSCGTPSLSGTITVNPVSTLTLTSAASTTSQSICLNDSITNIVYTFGGSAIGATVTGLPGGVIAVISGNTVTISGTPLFASATPYTYTITAAGGNCGFPSLSGTITVSPTATLTLTSAGSTTSQTVCIGSPITPITYTFGGSATGATVTGLPAGVTFAVSGTTITISGSPSTTVGSPFTYTVNTTGGSCGAPSLTGTITVNPLATLVLTSAVATANQTVCVGSPIVDIVYTLGGSATGFSVSGSALTVSGLPAGV
ncbi:hypothetical protein OX283_012230, partial [Flavobacterium sp. SUN052]|uniref:beta strand repeat-containing protein n=1 Tax=Flavobacterium sp. SUN052 TaxID=3002441 RepID=UPI0023A41647|nr:hypothetical protein [Flavobacterium sp. SUN052]